MNPCSLTKECYEKATKSWLCIGCASPKNISGPINIVIQEDMPENTPLNFVSGSGLGIAKIDFLFLFGKNTILNHLYTGSIFNLKGLKLPNFVTFYGKYSIIVKGTKNVTYRKCELCGRILYFAMGKKYLYPAPESNILIFDSGNGGLVIKEDLIKNIAKDQYSKLTISRLNVCKKPIQGIADIDQ